MANMTRKHFELIASAIARVNRYGNNVDASTMEQVINELTDTLATTNGQFKRERFKDACRGED